MPQEVLERTGQTVLAMPLDKGLRMGGDHSRIGAIRALTATDDRILRVEIEIDHRRQIQIKTLTQYIPSSLGGQFARRQEIPPLT